jgi:two-component system cell cycle response regulator DivK
MRRRLLIVDDRELDRELLVQIFEELHDIELATDGETAVDVAAATSPDLVLLDIGLPGLTGLEAVRAIKAQAGGVPVIAVSSRVMPGDREQALAAGFDEFVSKPIDDVRLVEIVDRLLDGR